MTIKSAVSFPKSTFLAVEHSFNEAFHKQLIQKAAVLAKRHNHAVYLFRSILQYFHTQKVIIPAYSFLQREVVSPTIREEHLRLEQFIEKHMTDAEKGHFC